MAVPAGPRVVRIDHNYSRIPPSFPIMRASQEARHETIRRFSVPFTEKMRHWIHDEQGILTLARYDKKTMLDPELDTLYVSTIKDFGNIRFPYREKVCLMQNLTFDLALGWGYRPHTTTGELVIPYVAQLDWILDFKDLKTITILIAPMDFDDEDRPLMINENFEKIDALHVPLADWPVLKSNEMSDTLDLIKVGYLDAINHHVELVGPKIWDDVPVM